MPIGTRRRRRVAIALACLLLPAGLAAGDSDSDSDSDSDRYPIDLELLSPVPPKKDEESRAILFRSGWPLTFRASVTDDDFLGIGPIDRDDPILFAEPAWFDRWGSLEGNRPAALVLEDPDDMWSFGTQCFECNSDGTQCVHCPHDETFVEFYPDRGDLRGVWDVGGSPYRRQVLADPVGRPEIGGPALGSGVGDGVGYGADDDFPSLVLLSNVGVGIVLEDVADGWEPVVPAQRRNLAGFMSTVGYELSDQKLRTSITASMIVPHFLFSHIRILDACVGPPIIEGFIDEDGNFGFGVVGCEGSAIQRIDGGPIEPEAKNDVSVVELRAFLVAPIWDDVEQRLDHLDRVTDMDGDGAVGAADAELMGWTVVSNEVVYGFTQIGTQIESRQGPYGPFVYCHGLDPILVPDVFVITSETSIATRGADFIYDIDGNSHGLPDVISIGCPPGSGGTTQVPRG